MTEATPPAGRGRHTPGVWTATRAKIADNVGGYDYGISAVIDGKPRVIAEAFQRVGEAESGRYIDVDVEANARLIAAAPQMLEALNYTSALLRAAASAGARPSTGDLNLIAGRVRAAITAALGEQQKPVDPRDPDPTRAGIFRNHNCWKCKSGEKPCANGNPNQCEFPHARND